MDSRQTQITSDYFLKSLKKISRFFRHNLFFLKLKQTHPSFQKRHELSIKYLKNIAIIPC